MTLEVESKDSKLKGDLDEKDVLKRAETEAKAHSAIVCTSEIKLSMFLPILGRKRGFGSGKQLQQGCVEDLENVAVSIVDEDKVILLLNALPRPYDQLCDAILYGRERTIALLENSIAFEGKGASQRGFEGTEGCC